MTAQTKSSMPAPAASLILQSHNLNEWPVQVSSTLGLQVYIIYIVLEILQTAFRRPVI
uniref:Uncharacterized protein n=1 Tax=Arion vulgaris TaxID=1028688 RepID=A0A0B7A4K3_9EUPU